MITALYLIKSYPLEIHIKIFTDAVMDLLPNNQVWEWMSGWGYK